VADALTIVTSLVGGSLGGAGLGAWQSARLQGMTRRGRARLVHEDLYRLQSTVTRLFYETLAPQQWGSTAWLLSALASKDDQQDVVAHLKDRTDFSNCAGALGWAEFVREGYGQGTAPSDTDLVAIYGRLDLGRRAIAGLAKLDYDAHYPDHVVAPEARLRNQAASLTP